MRVPPQSNPINGASVARQLFDVNLASIINTNSSISVGAKLYFLESDGVTLATIYTTPDGMVQNANPMLVQNDGRFAQQAWLDGGSYIYVLTGPLGDLSSPLFTGKYQALPLSSPSGASQIGTADGGTVQSALDDLTADISTLQAAVPEYWIADFYATGVSTDIEALQAFFDLMAATPGRSGVLKFRPGAGRGDNGQYLIDAEVAYTGYGRIELDLCASTLHFKNVSARIRYNALDVVLDNDPFVPGPEYFEIRGGDVKYEGTVDNPFYWNFPYRPSRVQSTGGVNNLHISGLDSQTANIASALFRCRNTWQFAVDRVLAFQKGGLPNDPVNPVINANCVTLEDMCAETWVTRSEIWYFNSAVVSSNVQLLGVDGSITGGSYVRGYKVTQGSAIGYFCRDDNYEGYDYTLRDVSGTFSAGAAAITTPDGAAAGTLTITATAAIYQPAEAILVTDGTAVVSCNYGVACLPSSSVGTKRTVNVVWGAAHCAFYISALDLQRCATVSIGAGANFQFKEAPLSNPAFTCINLTSCSNVSISGVTSTDEAYAGTSVFMGARDTSGLVMIGNTLAGYSYHSDVDATVTDSSIVFNIGLNTGPARLNGATLFNSGTAPHALKLGGNAFMGIGQDQF